MRYRREELQTLAAAHGFAALLVGVLAIAWFTNFLTTANVLPFTGAVFLIAGGVLFRLVTRQAKRPPRIASTFSASFRCDSVEQSSAGAKPPSLDDLLQQLRTADWFQFEQLIGLLYSSQGYAVTRRGGANPDGGIDLVIEKDGSRSAVQCKHWKAWKIGVKTIREFLGALTDARIQRGIIVTLQGYTDEAKHLAAKHGIELLSEIKLKIMLKEANDAAILKALYDPRKLCPKCERQMVLRTATKGPNAGNKFWGCSGFPKCRYVMQAAGKQ